MRKNKNLKKDDFILEVPNEQASSIQTEQKKKENIEKYRKLIKEQIEVIKEYQDIEINEYNAQNIEKLILATQDLIGNCISDNYYKINLDSNFNSITYICQDLSLRLKAYYINKSIEKVEDKQKELEKKQLKAEEQSNNLVYNLLSFLASFSIVSGVIGTVEKINRNNKYNDIYDFYNIAVVNYINSYI